MTCLDFSTYMPLYCKYITFVSPLHTSKTKRQFFFSPRIFVFMGNSLQNAKNSPLLTFA